jgi:hypothetical protein
MPETQIFTFEKGNILPNENLIMNFFIAAFFIEKWKVDLKAENVSFPSFGDGG